MENNENKEHLKKNIYIALGSTATEGLKVLISQLKKHGIYKITDRNFSDRFIAIDTAQSEIDKFMEFGSHEHLEGILIKSTDECEESIPAKRAKDYITILNDNWSQGNVTVDVNGVYSERQRSYADLSWVDALKTSITSHFAESEPSDCKIIIVATSYGGSSSGLFMNVSEVARTCVHKRVPLYGFLMLPCESLKRKKLDNGSDYEYGWLNFLNTWQQIQQTVWQSKLKEQDSMPFYAGYMDSIGNLGSCMRNNLFRIKPIGGDYDEKFRTARKNCTLPFSMLFPLIPDSGVFDTHYHPKAFAELAIFLFYNGVMEHQKIKDGANFSASNGDYTGTDADKDEKHMCCLRLVGAKSSSYSIFYNQAVKVLLAECEKFLTNADISKISCIKKSEDLLGELVDDELKGIYDNIIEEIDEATSEADINRIVYKDIDITKKTQDAYETKAFSKILPFFTFSDFVDKSADNQPSVAKWLEVYKKFYAFVQKEREELNNRREKIKNMPLALRSLIETYGERSLGKVLNQNSNLTINIINIAKAILKDAFVAFHCSLVADRALQQFDDKSNKILGPEYKPTSISEHATRYVKNNNSAAKNFLDIKYLKEKLNILENGTDAVSRQDFFIRDVQVDISPNCNKFTLYPENSTDLCYEAARNAIQQLLKRFMLGLKVNADRAADIKGLMSDFDKAITLLIQLLQNHVASLTHGGRNIELKLLPEQKAYIPSTFVGEKVNATCQKNSLDMVGEDTKFKGSDPALVFLRKEGAPVKGINFTAPNVTLQKDFVDGYGLTSFKAYFLPKAKDRVSKLNKNVPYDYKLTLTNGNDLFGIRTDDPDDKIAATVPEAFVTQNNVSCPKNVNDLFGVWYGEGYCNMSAQNVILSYIEQNNIVPKINYKDLQSRLLFTLHELVYFGIFIGIIKKKVEEVIHKAEDGNATISVKIKSSDNTIIYKIKDGISPEEFGVVGNRLEAVPIGLMEALSDWFRRNSIDNGTKGETSKFAKSWHESDCKLGPDTDAMTVADLESAIEQKEIYLFRKENFESLGIPKNIKKAIDALREKCRDLVEVEIHQ